MNLVKTSVLCAASCCVVGAVQADVVAYWDQNSNTLEPSGFGFTPASFPQAADQGAGSLTLANFNEATETGGEYSFIQSFAGTTTNALAGVQSGGSFSPQGAENNTNNGMEIILQVSTIDIEDVVVSWAQRGTSTGFTSRAFSYSVDGVAFTPVGTDTGALSSSWETEVYDLSAVSAIEDQAEVFFKITLDGATGSSGNNRFDNILVEGTVIPEPGSLALLGLGGLLIARRRRTA